MQLGAIAIICTMTTFARSCSIQAFAPVKLRACEDGYRVTICESPSLADDGQTACYARQRRTRKHHKIREINLPPDLHSALWMRRPLNEQPEDFMFSTPKGNPIDDHSFSQGICKKIGIERVPYAARHSLSSHLLENGAYIPQVAGILGNRPETTARHYSHMLNRPNMPEF
jgi:integrase